MANRGSHSIDDVIVIGAGAAGLAAAHRLSTAGLRVTIVEARDRIGGRIHTLRPLGSAVAIEAGAEFIHGDADETWSIVRAAGLDAVEVSEHHESYPSEDADAADANGGWERIFTRLDALQENDMSFADFLQQHCADVSPAARTQAVAYVEGFNAADKHEVSTRWLSQSVQATTDERSFRLKGGYDQVIQWLHRGIDPARSQLHLGTVVNKVTWRLGHVVVEVSNRAGGRLLPLVAYRAIITLPLGVLQLAPGSAGAVEFTPDLTEKRAAWNRLRMGPVVKIILRFREPFWERRGHRELVFLHAPDQPIVTWWTTSPVPSSVLTGWSGGAQVKALEGMTEAEILRAGLETLSRLFAMPRDDLAALLESSHVFDWRADPYSRGAYAYVPVDALDAPDKLAEPIDNTLFFAGEATDSRRMGTVAGAIASGYRAADEVLQAVIT